MKAIYKLIDYVFDELPRPGVIEAEEKRQEEKGWRVLSKTQVTPELAAKQMSMSIQYQKFTP